MTKRVEIFLTQSEEKNESDLEKVLTIIISRVSEEEEQNSNSSTPSSENNNDKPETEEQQKNDNPLTISEKIIALLEMSADYKQGQEKFFDRVIELLDLMRSAVVPSQKIKSLEDFLYKHEEQKQELQPLTELVKK
ncbi:46057_t:CDS:2 [Gigaspora margarita]|uniref:46057_t:CDS:1 n=1 Tax=Gigaspora margarita TaxID=4874 RepID=A0ABM8VWV6_GIGMA|nr:46057_t:CDS:2 [Gigaspora margarita]